MAVAGWNRTTLPPYSYLSGIEFSNVYPLPIFRSSSMLTSTLTTSPQRPETNLGDHNSGEGLTDLPSKDVFCQYLE